MKRCLSFTALLLSGFGTLAQVFAADFSWNSSLGGDDWDVAGNWLVVAGSDANNIPDADDVIVNPTLFGAADLHVGFTVSSFNYSVASNWAVISQTAGGNTLNILGDLTKAGSGALVFRRSSTPPVQANVGGNLLITGGSITIGEAASDLSTLTVNGTTTITDSTLSFTGTGQRGTLTGVVAMNGTGRINLAGQTVAVAAGISSSIHVGGLSSTSIATLVTNNSNSTNGNTGTLVLNNSLGTSSYAGLISDGSNTGADNVLHVEKNNAGTQVFSGTNTYIGKTTVHGGTLLVNGTHTATVHPSDLVGDPAMSHLAANGGGSYLVESGARLGGTGTITATPASAGVAAGTFTIAGGGHLQGGAGATGQTLGLSGNLTLQDGAIIDLALGSGGTHSTLARSGGTWSFDSDQTFLFSDLGVGAGDSFNNIITGLLGTESGMSLGSIGGWTIQNAGWTGTFSYDGSGGVDLTLSAVPEAETSLLLLGGVLLLALRRTASRTNKRQRSLGVCI